MKQSVLAGVVLAVLVALWTLVMGVTGWYKNPVAAMLFYLVIPINVAVVIWGLYRTKAEGRRYGGQVVAGVVIGIVAAILIFGNSLLFTQVLFPTYTEDVLAGQEELLRSSGASEEQIAAQLDIARTMMKPSIQAATGAFFTFLTTMVTTLIAAAFIRVKD